ncbi:hypothetical protein [Saccharococcus thermophilus]|uniref:hypothetical protein n=1 Tax=Saccharococcus thermophilus TaxID=29396 RepID=UPI0036D2A5D8
MKEGSHTLTYTSITKKVTNLLPLLIAYFLKNSKNIPVHPPTGSSPKDVLDFYVKNVQEISFFCTLMHK